MIVAVKPLELFFPLFSFFNNLSTYLFLKVFIHKIFNVKLLNDFLKYMFHLSKKVNELYAVDVLFKKRHLP